MKKFVSILLMGFGVYSRVLLSGVELLPTVDGITDFDIVFKVAPTLEPELKLVQVPPPEYYFDQSFKYSSLVDKIRAYEGLVGTQLGPELVDGYCGLRQRFTSGDFSNPPSIWASRYLDYSKLEAEAGLGFVALVAACEHERIIGFCHYVFNVALADYSVLRYNQQKRMGYWSGVLFSHEFHQMQAFLKSGFKSTELINSEHLAEFFQAALEISREAYKG